MPSTPSLTRQSRRTTREQVERIGRLDALRVLDHDGVSGIVSSGTPSADVRFGGKDIDELALAFIAPLGTEPKYGQYAIRLSRPAAKRR